MPRVRFAPLIVVLCVLATFGRLLFADFTWWDDQETIHHNPLLNPPTFESLAYYWTHFVQGLYAPVTYTAWAGLARIAYIGQPDSFGIYLNPLVFHLANVLVHGGASLLVLAILRRLLSDDVAALLGALLFTLHPVQVETVAWISGLKDLLCWLLSLATTLCFLRARERASIAGRPIWRVGSMQLAAAFLVLAALSKPTAMVVPAILWTIDGLLLRTRWARSVVELLPLFAIALASAIVARVAQYVHHVPAPPLYLRPFIAGDALAFYLGKLLWPASLSIDYGRLPAVILARPLTYAIWLIPAAAFVALVAARRQAPVLAAAGAIALLGVAPVLGIAPFQMQTYSTVTDHYLYFAMLGPALGLGWALREWPGALTRGCAIVWIAALGVRSIVQAGVWRDSFTLFEHATAVNPRSFAAHGNLASLYMTIMPPDPTRAEPEVETAIAIAPDNYFVLNGYASAKFSLGKRAEALRAWEKVIRLGEAAGPAGVQANAALATEVAQRLLEVNEPDAAVTWGQMAVVADPADPRGRAVLASARKALAAQFSTTTTAAPTRPPASAPAR